MVALFYNMDSLVLFESVLYRKELPEYVDNLNEQAIQKSLNNLMKNRTVLVIAHRLSTVKNADQIIVMDEGKIIETGSHNQLYDKEGMYYNLYNVQFEI